MRILLEKISNIAFKYLDSVHLSLKSEIIRIYMVKKLLTASLLLLLPQFSMKQYKSEVQTVIMVAAFYFILSMYILSFSKQVSSVCYEPGIWYLESNCVLAFKRTLTNAIIPNRQSNSVHTRNCVCVYIYIIYTSLEGPMMRENSGYIKFRLRRKGQVLQQNNLYK